MTNTKDTDHAKEQAKAQLDSIKEMVKALHDSTDENGDRNDDAYEDALQAINEDPLSVEVRSGWHVPTDGQVDSEEYMILLCTGGPACRIVGNLSEHNEPESAKIEYQDWGTPWTEYRLTSKEEEIVIEYARCFYYGE